MPPRLKFLLSRCHTCMTPLIPPLVRGEASYCNSKAETSLCCVTIISAPTDSHQSSPFTMERCPDAIGTEGVIPPLAPEKGAHPSPFSWSLSEVEGKERGNELGAALPALPALSLPKRARRSGVRPGIGFVTMHPYSITSMLSFYLGFRFALHNLQ